ncbi:hypothetical protein [Luteimonas aquatica]|uniref:hypothetical protein n=1 Tax=Luteimonas aquatica TaxID=450364 RepID=UPI001F57D14D|nr:hypothetical protein [Luteimonas aquatica]
MTGRLARLRHGALALAVLGGLAFGAGQALATAEGARPAKAACNDKRCRIACEQLGYHDGGIPGSQGRCFCC